MLQVYLFLCLIILFLILLSINIKITNIKGTNDKKKKKICVLKNCNKQSNVNSTTNMSLQNAILNKVNNTSCNRVRTPLNNVHNKFYLN